MPNHSQRRYVDGLTARGWQPAPRQRHERYYVMVQPSRTAKAYIGLSGAVFIGNRRENAERQTDAERRRIRTAAPPTA